MKGTLAQELDFVNEGKNSERCQKDLNHLGYVYVPKVHWDLTSTVSMMSEGSQPFRICLCSQGSLGPY